MARVTISLSNKLLEKIDSERGLVKRSTWIIDIIDKYFDTRKAR